MEATLPTSREAAAGTPGLAQPDELLRLTDVVATYRNGAIRALEGVSLGVGAGSIVALLGANGAGKTTVIRAVTGLLAMNGGRLNSGSVYFDGRRIDGTSPSRRVALGLSQVMEGRRIFADLTVDENLQAGAFAVRDKRQRKDSYERVMTLFPLLQEMRSRVAGYLSGGEQQMLAIGRALMQNPKLLLLDEPSLGLAPRIVQRVRETLGEINAGGTSILAGRAEHGDGAFGLRLRLRARAGTSRALGAVGAVAPGCLDRRPLPRRLGLGAREPGDMSAGPFLEVEDVAVQFGGIRALSDVSFTCQRGELLAIIGPNGAGKSSLFNVLTGVYPANGRVMFNGTSLLARRPAAIARLGIARTFQNLGLFEPLTVLDNLLIGRHVLMGGGVAAGALWVGRAKREDRAARLHCHELLDLLDLRRYKDEPVRTLPFGSRSGSSSRVRWPPSRACSCSTSLWQG